MSYHTLGAVSSLPSPTICPTDVPKSECGPKGGPPPPVFPATPWFFPVPGGRISSVFGCRHLSVGGIKGRCKLHAGTDITKSEGARIVAPAAGTVVHVGADPTRSTGRDIVIKHDDGVFSWYMHLLAQNVVNGQKVRQGDFIGLMGKTGMRTVGGKKVPSVTGPHLHWQVFMKNAAGKRFSFDPMYYLPNRIFGGKRGLYDDKSGSQHKAALVARGIVTLPGTDIRLPGGVIAGVPLIVIPAVLGAAALGFWLWRRRR